MNEEKYLELFKIPNRIKGYNEPINFIQNNVSDVLIKFSESMQKLISTEYMEGLSKFLTVFSNQINIAKNDPNSYFSYISYEKELNSFHWAWPYQISAEEIKSLIESAQCEKDFDEFMIHFFDDAKINKIFQEFVDKLPSRHKMMIKQIKHAIERNDFAIANNALMSILDNMLSDYLENKGQVKREGILEPIIKYYEVFPLHEVEFLFGLTMLSNNINFIFQDYNFDENLKINSNKKIRRHPSIHGVRYSNKKVDTLLLVNTLINLIENQEYLKLFIKGLRISRRKGKKVFIFTDKKERELIELECKQRIIDIITLNKNTSHGDILEVLEDDILKDIEDKRKFLSTLLQKMKCIDKTIISCKVKGKTYWKLYNAKKCDFE